MDEDMWRPEFMAKRLASGLFAPVVTLHRSTGEGAHESSLTYTGEYATWAEAAEAARRLHGRGGTSPLPDDAAA